MILGEEWVGCSFTVKKHEKAGLPHVFRKLCTTKCYSFSLACTHAQKNIKNEDIASGTPDYYHCIFPHQLSGTPRQQAIDKSPRTCLKLAISSGQRLPQKITANFAYCSCLQVGLLVLLACPLQSHVTDPF